MQATLNLVHVFSAVLWAGGTLFLALFVSRAAQAAGPGAAPFMGALVTRTRVVDAMTWASIFTVGSGLWLWIRRFGSAMPSGFDGVAISVGALAGISALVVGVARQRPTIIGMRRLIEEIGNQAPSEEQIGRMAVLRASMTRNGNTLAVFVTIAVAGMALGA